MSERIRELEQGGLASATAVFAMTALAQRSNHNGIA